ncbi:MAG TPA: cupredoxin domain-containing protein [Gaiellaceae bacterium]|nr:cupredoxin domain-containing protein [Gaiellaceae bacterium]
MSARVLLLAAVSGVLLVAAGCGGDGEAAAPVATTEVTMPKSYRFDPDRIAVEPGATVTFRNEDNLTHTVKVDGGADHKVSPGESVSITFGDPGTHHYVCTLQPHDMDGEVIVG